MFTRPVRPILSLLLVAFCCASATAENTKKSDYAAFELDAGQRLTVVLPRFTGNDPDALDTYVKGAFRIAEPYGLQEGATFPVEHTYFGDLRAEVVGLYHWPNARASEESRAHPEYVSKFKPLRSKAWSQFAAIDVDLEEDLSLSFDANKTYTFAVAWIDKEDDYNAYLKASQPVRDRLGARFVMMLKPDNMFTLDEEPVAKMPDYIVILEWPDAKGPELYMQSPEVQANQDLINGAIGQIWWYRMGFWQDEAYASN